jgi:hypothetical protein
LEILICRRFFHWFSSRSRATHDSKMERKRYLNWLFSSITCLFLVHLKKVIALYIFIMLWTPDMRTAFLSSNHINHNYRGITCDSPLELSSFILKVIQLTFNKILWFDLINRHLMLKKLLAVKIKHASFTVSAPSLLLPPEKPQMS